MSNNVQREFVVSTSNKHKLLELQAVARLFHVTLLAIEECRDKYHLPPFPYFEENGGTYLENARIKAKVCCFWSRLPSIGDDSGLEVACLDNRPGINSARYAGENASDDERIAKIISEVQKVGELDKKACFRCVLVACFPNGREVVSRAQLEGEVLSSKRGVKGFGYDPIILIHTFGKTLAELDFDVVCKEGFRATAAKQLFAELSQEAK